MIPQNAMEVMCMDFSLEVEMLHCSIFTFKKKKKKDNRPRW